MTDRPEPGPRADGGASPAPRPRAAFAMGAATAAALFPDLTRTPFHDVCDMAPGDVLEDFGTPRAAAVLRETELLVTGWGCPPLDRGVLDAAPRLRAVVHTAGSVRAHVTPACFERGVTVSSAAAANALPVAEYTVAMILLTGKRVLEHARDYRRTRARPDWLTTPRSEGNHRRTVGIVSASLVGRRVMELLRPYDLRVLLYDPFVDDAEARGFGAEPAALPELFRRSDVVSVHAPLLDATRGLVDRALLRSMRPDAVLINTARGAVLDQDALTEVVLAGRVRAVLDVTDPEVLPAGHPLWDCENVLVTPHLAGSQGNEWDRLVASAAAEAARFASGAGFAHPVPPDRLAFLA